MSMCRWVNHSTDAVAFFDLTTYFVTRHNSTSLLSEFLRDTNLWLTWKTVINKIHTKHIHTQQLHHTQRCEAE